MFSSANNASLFPTLSPSYHHLLSPPPFLGGDDTDFLTTRSRTDPGGGYDVHHPDLFMTDTLFGLVVSNKSPIGNQVASEPNGQNYGPKSMQPKMMKKAAAKKHKCTKILTAQGLRDRRVRLSIETARKFFDLQDMLGFEKASKTIDWLLKNSRTEIKDLLNRVKEKRSTLCSTASEFEVISGAGTKMKNLIEVKLQKAMAAFDDTYLASRESRARARERARERTREKILRSKLKGSSISSDEQQISEENFKFVPNFGRPVTSTVNGILV